jgi:hypothetical protein
MGKTVPSYRMALEFEIDRWKRFRKALASEEDREAFEMLMDMYRNNAMASGAACNPIIFEPMVLSILLARRKSLLSRWNRTPSRWSLTGKISVVKPFSSL